MGYKIFLSRPAKQVCVFTVQAWRWRKSSLRVGSAGCGTGAERLKNQKRSRLEVWHRGIKCDYIDDDGQLFQLSNVNSILNYETGYWIFLVHCLYHFSSPLLPICILGFDELLTPAEKAKLYTAIGYSETDVNHLPKNVSHFLSDTDRPNDAFLFVFQSVIQCY